MHVWALQEYLQTVDLPRLLLELGAPNVDLLVGEIKHFTEKEARKRDKIVLSYFGEDGVKKISEAIVNSLKSPPRLRVNARILDMGAGSGFFTTRIVHKLRENLPHASFYAMDATPQMLLALARKTDLITPFFGIAENIPRSIQKAKRYAKVPRQFDAVFSTLMLHHCQDVNKVFQSLRKVLKTSAKAVIVDLCTHPFAEFREEMGDLHLGFAPEQIKKAAKEVFSKATVEKLLGIHCESSGRLAEIFVATLLP